MILLPKTSQDNLDYSIVSQLELPFSVFSRKPSSFHKDNPESTDDVTNDVLEKALIYINKIRLPYTYTIQFRYFCRRSLKERGVAGPVSLSYLKYVACMSAPLASKQSTPDIQHRSEASWETKSDPPSIRAATNVTHCAWQFTQGKNVLLKVRLYKTATEEFWCFCPFRASTALGAEGFFFWSR